MGAAEALTVKRDFELKLFLICPIPRFAVLAALFALAACDMPQSAGEQKAPVDPYASLADGGARYTGPPSAPEGAVIAGAASVEAFKASVGNTVTFTEGEASLTEEARRIAAAQAAWLVKNREYSARIEGHSDEQGTREYNLALAARRAAAVQEYLIASGVEATRLSTVSYGRERPLSDCSGAACADSNRRVVTIPAHGAGV